MVDNYIKKIPNKLYGLLGIPGIITFYRSCSRALRTISLHPLKRDPRCSIRNVNDPASLKSLFFQGFLHDFIMFVGIDPDMGDVGFCKIP